MSNQESQKRISAFAQWKEFTIEYVQMTLGDKKNLLISLLFPVIAGFILIWIAGAKMFGEMPTDTQSGCFVIVSAAIWGGLFNSIQVIVKDRKNVKRSYVAGARIGCYTLSRAFIQLLLCAFQSFILTLSFEGVKIIHDRNYPDKGIILDNTLLEFFVSIFLLMYAADALGLMISCIVRKAESANVMAPYILIVQLIFAGIFFKLEGFASTLSAVMISRWGMEAIGSTAGLYDIYLNYMLNSQEKPEYEATVKHLGTTWGVLLAFIVISLFVGNLLLHRVSKDARD